MTTYEELKTELSNVSKILEQFPDPLKEKVFDLLMGHFLGQNSVKASSSGIDAAEQEGESLAAGEKRKENKGKSTSKKGPAKESYKIDRHLNLRGDGSIPSFRNFVEEKTPSTQMEFNAVAVYYLRKILKQENVTLDHVFTCYGEVTRRPPEAFRQSFTDTKNKQGWVEFDESGYLQIPHRGAVFVEHDLPRKEKKA